MMRRRPGILLLLLGLLPLSGCAGAAMGQAHLPLDSPTPVASPIYVEPNWDNPIWGVAAPSLEAAADAAAFTVVAPPDLGSPTGVYTDFPVADGPVGVVAFVYDSAVYGRVVVIENPPDVPPEDYDATNQAIAEEVTLNAAQGRAFGTAAIVVLPTGERALATTSPDGEHSSLAWLEGGTEVIVRGPHLLPAQALEIASRISSSARAAAIDR